MLEQKPHCLIGTEAAGYNKQYMLGAGNGARTRDLNLGKVALYQLSYSRIHISILPLITQGVTLYSAKGGQTSELFPLDHH